MKISLALLVLLAATAPVRALELSLEENRAERGSVGYVDMQRLFMASPDALRAKESFQELIRQAEERVNLRKAELLRLRQELEAARAERETVAKSTVEAPSLPAASSATAATPAAAAPTASLASAASSTAPLVAAPRPLPVALPGMSTPILAPTAPAASSATAAAPLPAVSTAPAAAPVLPPAPPVVVSTGPTLGQRLLEIDARIIALQSDITKKEAALTSEHDEADRGLLDVESRRTDQVLARIYRAISEVAHREGVSVVVDKTTLLYGQPAVDMTDKVLKYLRETP